MKLMKKLTVNVDELNDNEKNEIRGSSQVACCCFRCGERCGTKKGSTGAQYEALSS